MTRLGLSCLKWNDPAAMRGGEIFDNQKLVDHNFCRNMDGDVAPWCMVNEKQYDVCDFPKCDEIPEKFQCEPDEIQCGELQKCVAKEFVCDYDSDCPNGIDEQNCSKF